MPIFQYSGYRTDGSEVAGTIEASNPKDAVLKLKESGLYPNNVRETISREKAGLFRRSDADVLPSVTRQLSTLLASGVTLMEALNAIADENSGFWKNLLINIKEQVAAGASFSKALEQYNMIFPEFYVNMVAAGETSGSLDRVLVQLADFLETQSQCHTLVESSNIGQLRVIGQAVDDGVLSSPGVSKDEAHFVSHQALHQHLFSTHAGLLSLPWRIASRLKI